MIYGCHCDAGWQGVGCNLRTCPLGDDPNTKGADETQLIDCKCDTCTGGFTIAFNGEITRLIPFDTTPALIEYALEVI
jgi:hypothetical protein